MKSKTFPFIMLTIMILFVAFLLFSPPGHAATGNELTNRENRLTRQCYERKLQYRRGGKDLVDYCERLSLPREKAKFRRAVRDSDPNPTRYRSIFSD